MRIAGHISGDRVFTALQQHPEGLPDKTALADATGLSVNQVKVGLIWVRDVLASEHNMPVTWTRDHGYQLAPDFDICRAYEHAQLRSRLVGLTRLMKGTIGPHAALDPDDEWVMKASHIVTATCDSLSLLTDARPG